MTYFYIDAHGQTCGPILESEFAVHGITPDTPLWCEGMEEWARARNIPALKAYFEGTTPAAPAPEVRLEKAEVGSEEGAVRLGQVEKPLENAVETSAMPSAPTAVEAEGIGSVVVTAGTEDVTPSAVTEVSVSASEKATPPPLPASETALATPEPTLATPEFVHGVGEPALAEPGVAPASLSAQSVRSSWEATQRVDLMESLDVWKWVNACLVFFGILSICFSLSWIAIPLGVMGIVQVNGVLRYAENRSTEELQKALKRTRIYFFIGCLLFVVGIVGQVLLSAVMSML